MSKNSPCVEQRLRLAGESLDGDNRYPSPEYDVYFIQQCMVTHVARLWIKPVRLPVLLVVSWTGKMNISLSAFVSENLVSRDGFGDPVPRQPAHLHTLTESGAYLRDSSRVLRRRPFIYVEPPYAIGSVPSFIGSRNCVPMAFTAESPPAQGQ